ncbi:MAG: polysaccharide biosynthesis/export family protein [Gammaproteobacteria bacterium]|nr:polysaccharide biosynthesis/export family protein [Gammaproteobacteria bacterium]
MLKQVNAGRLLRVAALLLAPAFAVQAADTLPARDPYRINPGDILQVSVWKEQDLQSQLLVNPDGHFSFPLAGDIRAEGKTLEEVREELVERLGKLIPDVVVTVSTLKLEGNKVYVLGQVARPGEFIVTRSVDVMQAIAMAGGTTPFAKLDDVKILRRGTQGAQTAIPFRYSDVQQGRKLDQNIVLRAGDTIVVP